jgi:ComF family protein
MWFDCFLYLSAMKRLTQNLNDFLGLFFPGLCVACGERLVSQEQYVCFNCWHDLPVTNFHSNPENKVAQLFWGRVVIENATSFFSYRKGSNYQQLIHGIKYKGMKELGYETGRKFGFLLAEAENFNSVDVVVPVPLHPQKQKKRGYNQSEWIARGIAEPMGKNVSSENLVRKMFTATQTRKTRFERWQNVEGIFDVDQPEDFSGKHILLVDDVVTTGSTLEACAFQLLKIENTKVSIATLAFADY